MQQQTEALDGFTNIENLLLDEEENLVTRMQVIFSLRNDSSDAAIEALCAGFRINSALLRHELAYVLD